MDEASYRTWWQLHLRVSRGETLAPEEQAAYDAARRVLDDDELRALVEQVRAARRDVRALEAERARLEQRRQELDAEIAALEQALPEA